jgi:hypothetical protein
MTLAPPPATIVQMRPFGFNIVSFREAPVCSHRNVNLDPRKHNSIPWRLGLVEWVISRNEKSYLFIHPVDALLGWSHGSSKRQWKFHIAPPAQCNPSNESLTYTPGHAKETSTQCSQVRSVSGDNAYFWKFLKRAVSSSSPRMSSGQGTLFTNVKGFISRRVKSKSEKNSGANGHQLGYKHPWLKI